MIHTWQGADVSDQEPYNGDFKEAMASIKAKTLVLPSKTDLYFPPEDSELELECMTDGVGELAVFPSIWGHWAGGPPGNFDDVKWLDDKLKAIFSTAPQRDAKELPIR
ncbi:homoserine acetyltransferase family protein [Colletotrichum tofieldiae]|nr:homoserine acetyltransferase family protein [Colletotrichum tofieldiae]